MLIFRKSKRQNRPGVSPIHREDRRDFWLFVSPWLFGLVLFSMGPMLASLVLSFTDYNIFNRPSFVGAANYRELLLEDPLVYKAIWNTVFFTVFAVPLGNCLAMGMAILLNQKVFGIPVWRTVFYLPTVVSGVAMAVLWRWIFNPEVGLLNMLLQPLLRFFGMENPSWLLDPDLAKPAYVLMTMWGVGGMMIVYLAGLQNVPQHLYEAAEIDGAGLPTKFRHVTLPMLSPAILFNVTMAIIGSFQIFTQAYVMTGRGPDDSTLFYVLYLFDQAFRYFRMGYGSAMAWVLFAIVLLVTITQFVLAKKWVYYEGEK